LSELDAIEFRRFDDSHLEGCPAVYCVEGVMYDGGVIRRGELVHRGHPAVRVQPWAFSADEPVDLTTPIDDVDQEHELDDDEPDEPAIPSGPYPELPPDESEPEVSVDVDEEGEQR
jgi:hypothetical protein